jgi:hypothetical protein
MSSNPVAIARHGRIRRLLLAGVFLASFVPGASRAQVCGPCLALPYRFSYDAPSNGLPFGPEDLLTTGPGFCADLGSDLDAFSFVGNACCFALPETTLVLYSVDRPTRGVLGTPIRVQDDCNGSAGDIFGVVVVGNLPPTALSLCFLVCDAPNLGLQVDTGGIVIESDLDALDADLGGYGCPPGVPYVYSTWKSETLVQEDGGVFPGPALVTGDELDAANVDSPTCIAYSLGPGSPSLTTWGNHPGDVLCAAGTSPPLVMLDHLIPLCLCDLGTPNCTQDNLDALWFVDPGERLGLCLIERSFPLNLSAPTIAVNENSPVLWVNAADPRAVQVSPVTVEVDGMHVFIQPGECGGIAGLRAGLRSGEVSYPYVVRNAFDPADSASGVIIVTTGATGVPIALPGLEGAVPSALRIVGVQPNPISETASITFDTPRPDRLRVGVFDVHGRRVRALADRSFAAGRHPLTWDGRDESGRPVANGTYFVRVECGRGQHARSVTVLR